MIRYAHTCDPLNSDFDDPADALGEPNYTRASDGTFPYCFNSGINAVALGDGGLIELEFVNNLLTNSGNSTADLYVFEVGTGDEPTFVELRPRDQATLQFLQTGGVRHDTDGDGFFEFGLIGGGTGSLDIDFGLGAPPGSLKFDAVQLVDDPSDGNCTSANDSPGADIDAIGAIQSAPVTAVVSRSWGAVKILHR